MVNLRQAKKRSARHYYLTRSVEHVLHFVGSTDHCANVNVFPGYWQPSLHAESQECQSFITLNGVFTSKRIMQGTTNAVSFLKSTLAGIITADLLSSVLFWLDNVLIRIRTVEGILDTVEQQFSIFKDCNLCIPKMLFLCKVFYLMW